MKRLLICAALIAGLASPALAEMVEVEVTGIRTLSGDVHVALFDEAGWRGGAPVDARSLAVTAETLSLTFEGIAPGRYGIRVYQDLNDNGDLDRGAMGMPREPYGFSNDAPVRMGPPGWKDTAFEVSDGGAVQTISLR